MWPLPKINDQSVGILCTPTSISFSHLATKGDGYCVKAYHHVPLEQNELANLIIYNPTVIQQETKKFLQKNNVPNAFISIACAGPTVQEQLMNVGSATPTRTMLQKPEFKKLVWDHCYLYPKEADHLFYTCGMQREHLAQYQLLFGASQLNLVAMTTPFMALLKAYKAIHGYTFRHSQLARDMELHGMHLEKAISHYTLEQHLAIPSYISAQETDHTALLTSLGLFLLGSTQ